MVDVNPNKRTQEKSARGYYLLGVFAISPRQHRTNPAYLLRSVRRKSNSQLTLGREREGVEKRVSSTRRGSKRASPVAYPAPDNDICNEIWFGKRAHAEILREILQQTLLQPNGKYTHTHTHI